MAKSIAPILPDLSRASYDDVVRLRRIAEILMDSQHREWHDHGVWFDRWLDRTTAPRLTET